MVDTVFLAQAASLVFGTVLAAPLMASVDNKSRHWGFMAMMLGALSALIVHIAFSLWLFAGASVFWFLMSVRGWFNTRELKS
ncbi:hypothetical protein OAI24_01170 [Alphaproteobacteria bacterium]|nr:hypothetical protein [Alphaproteobacteria bacterium]|tara:strand:- start:202 stop:447 length:246 start_codon:yes stop_codon:yes gene_type:complete